MRVMSCPFAMISVAGGAFDQGRPMGRGRHPVMASDAGDPSMDRLSILLLVDGEGNRLPIHLLLHILLPVAIHAEKDRGHDPLVAVQIGLTMALQTKFLLRFHD